MRTIAFCGGGSFGHVAAHFSVYPYIKKDFDRFIFIGSKGGVEKDFVIDKFPFYEIPVAKFDRAAPVKNLTLPIDLFKAVKSAKEILKKEKPCVIFCGGGFTCVPVTIAAHGLKIPVVLHESDYSCGLANRVCLPFCRKIATTFDDTLKNHPKTVCCGASVRRELYGGNKTAALKKFGFDTDKKVLLVLGGSKGSKAINDCLERIYERLLTRFQILHICGKNNKSKINAKGYVSLPFTDDMASVYAAADLAVSRCGSNAAFELVYLGIPTLFIPLSKKASRGDQIQNAEYFRKKGCALVLEEEDLTPEKLLLKITLLESSSEKLRSKMLGQKVVDANEKVARIILNNADN